MQRDPRAQPEGSAGRPPAATPTDLVDAAAAIAAGELDLAHEVFRGLLDRSPDDPVLNNRVGDFLALRKRYPEAAAYCMKAAELWSDRGDSGRTLAVLRKVLRWHPDHPGARRLKDRLLDSG